MESDGNFSLPGSPWPSCLATLCLQDSVWIGSWCLSLTARRRSRKSLENSARNDSGRLPGAEGRQVQGNDQVRRGATVTTNGLGDDVEPEFISSMDVQANLYDDTDGDNPRGRKRQRVEETEELCFLSSHDSSQPCPPTPDLVAATDILPTPPMKHCLAADPTHRLA